MFHNLEKSIKPHVLGHPVYTAWSAEGNRWYIRWNDSSWSASEDVFPFRSVRRGTLRQISEHLAALPKITAAKEG